MKLKFTPRIVPLLILPFVLPLQTGCVVYKNRTSDVPSAAITKQWEVRYPWHICVKIPQEADFICITNESQRKWQLGRTVSETQWLVEVLKQSHLFNEVTLSNAGTTACDLTIESSPRIDKVDDFSDPWLLLYCGVVPIYRGISTTVHFKFIDGASGDFYFNWSEHWLAGVWAPVVWAVGPKWSFKDSSDAYWTAFRSALIDRFDQIQR